MTVKELKEKLELLNPDMEVCIDGLAGDGDDWSYVEGPITHVHEHYNERTDTTVLYIGYNSNEESK